MLVNLELLFAALILLTAYMLLIQRRLGAMIYTFMWQSLLLAGTTLIEAIIKHEFALYFSVFLVVVFKVIFIPYFLLRLNEELGDGSKVQYPPAALVARPFLLSLIAVAVVLFSYHLLLPLHHLFLTMINGNVLAMALAVVLLGILLMITHRKAISHALGFMMIENGIFFAALIATSGMPMVVELGVAFDVLVAVILFGVSFFHISSNIDSLDVDCLNRLRE